MAKKPKISKKWSFKGFSFKTLVYNNKDYFKAVLGLVAASLVAVQAGQMTWAQSLALTGYSLATLTIKHVADAIDFLSSDVKLE